MNMKPLLDIENLSVSFSNKGTSIAALQNVSLSLNKGESLSLVGESGSGKTTLAMACLGLLDPAAKIEAGRIGFDDIDVLSATPSYLRGIRGTKVSMVFQNPRAALNPVRPIGRQLIDVIRAHEHISRARAKDKAIELLKAVKLPRPEERLKDYAFQLSGGMCQRVMIALAIAGNPRLLIADEPTTGLDATTQCEVMQLLSQIGREHEMAMILITHDLPLAAEFSHNIAIMKNGEIIEHGEVNELLSAPKNDYTRNLIAAAPVCQIELQQRSQKQMPTGRQLSAPTTDLLFVEGLCKRFKSTRAVDGVSFSLQKGESLGLVGESGSGKSTLARIITRLTNADSGRVLFDAEDITSIDEKDFHRSPYRKDIQLVFQDSLTSLNPQQNAFDAIVEPLRRLRPNEGAKNVARVLELAEQVLFEQNLLDRLPHQLSGGQLARVGIARALATSPRLLVLDEPTASLDVLTQAEILKLLERLRRENGLSYLFISHDLNVIRLMCKRIMVMKAGQIVEQGDRETIFDNAQHDYTRSLVKAMSRFKLDEDIVGI